MGVILSGVEFRRSLSSYNNQEEIKNLSRQINSYQVQNRRDFEYVVIDMKNKHEDVEANLDYISSHVNRISIKQKLEKDEIFNNNIIDGLKSIIDYFLPIPTRIINFIFSFYRYSRKMKI